MKNLLVNANGFDNFWLWTLMIAVTKDNMVVFLVRTIFSSHPIFVVQKIRKDLVPILSDEEGKCHITPHALQELVSKSCLGMDGIHSPSTNIIFEGDQISCSFGFKSKLIATYRTH